MLQIAAMKNFQHQKPPSREDTRRLVIAFAISMGLLLVYTLFVTKPRMEEAYRQQQIEAQQAVTQAETEAIDAAADQMPQPVAPVTPQRAAAEELIVDTPELVGTLSLRGARFEDIALRNHYKSLDDKDPVSLLYTPQEDQGSRSFIETGWTSEQNIALPTRESDWRLVAGGRQLVANVPVTVEWANGQGLLFRRVLTMDQDFLVTIEESVINQGGQTVDLSPYARVVRTHVKEDSDDDTTPAEDQATAIMHVGPVGYVGNELVDPSYDSLRDDREISVGTGAGWLGLGDKYWLTAILTPDNEVAETQRYRLRYTDLDTVTDLYQAERLGNAMSLAPRQTISTTHQFFVGAKELGVLKYYEKDMDVPQFDLAIDFGMFYFITRPFYNLLTFFGRLFTSWGLPMSFGLAILALTVVVRVVTFPLAHKAYVSMNKLKDMAPKMKELQEKYGDDKEQFQKAIADMYQREKINPAGGCLPMIVQIPIFFALYKVLYVAIEMRHTPFFGWIQDLSAPDSTNVLTLFGLIPIDLPQLITIGAWPAIYGATFWLQQRLSPPPTDPTQKTIFGMMPIMFTVFFAQFPVGIVIYYSLSNILGIAQQVAIRRSTGESTKIHLRAAKEQKHDRTKKAEQLRRKKKHKV